jgi:glycosyltransferase involved in cell wall biosynthesis
MTASMEFALDGAAQSAVAPAASEQAPLRVAIAHEWLVSYAGSERVVEQMCRVFPDARLLTTLRDDRVLPTALSRAETGVLQAIPGATARHQWLIPMMPLDWRLRKPLHDVDVVISSSHACAKAVRIAEGIPHVCYCHTPMRYAWDFARESGRFPAPLRLPVRAAMAGFRSWDSRQARRVTQFVANSRAVGERIFRTYGRSATVIHPPVDTDYFSPGGRRTGYFLYAGRLVSYKQPDILVEAFRNMRDQELVIAGAGPMLEKLRSTAPANVHFVVKPSDEHLRELYRGASALLHPGEEDFGITMVEAQSCGTPVIALRRGGALDIVSDGQTGVLFEAATPGSVRAAVERSQDIAWDVQRLVASASRFSRTAFAEKIRHEVYRVASSGVGASR